MVNNQHLAEVLCAIRFNPNKNPWDSTFFGKYHSLVEKHGYVEKTEKKDVDLEFQVNQAKNQSVLKQGQGQTRMVFANPEIRSAIIIGEHYISFHKISPYDNWVNFIQGIVKPRLDDYLTLGLGNGILEVQCLYLNKYVLEENESVSKYFNFLPILPGAKESQILFNGIYKIDLTNLVQLKLQTVKTNSGVREAFFECSSFANSLNEEGDFLKLAQIAHDNANEAYKGIIKN